MLDDAEGLRRAYAGEDGHHVFVQGSTMYTAGSTPPWLIFSRPRDVINDWFHDDPLLLFGKWGRQHTYRYQEQQRVLKANPQIRRQVGHSLSAATALELSDEYKGRSGLRDTTAYSTPTIDPYIPGVSKPDPRGERIRGTFDPVAMFDGNASKTIPTTSLNPHNYWQLSRGRMTPYYGDDIATKDGYINPDGSQSLFR